MVIFSHPTQKARVQFPVNSLTQPLDGDPRPRYNERELSEEWYPLCGLDGPLWELLDVSG